MFASQPGMPWSLEFLTMSDVSGFYTHTVPDNELWEILFVRTQAVSNAGPATNRWIEFQIRDYTTGNNGVSQISSAYAHPASVTTIYDMVVGLGVTQYNIPVNATFTQQYMVLPPKLVAPANSKIFVLARKFGGLGTFEINSAPTIAYRKFKSTTKLAYT